MMKPITGPLTRLLYSRKFLVLMLDTVISVVLYYCGGPDVEFLIAALQPVAMMMIFAIAKEDSARFAAGG
jgi:uncharacterized membrane protein YjjP (DUF1212 family)